MIKPIKMWAWYSPTWGLELEFYETRKAARRNNPRLAADAKVIRVEIRPVTLKKKPKTKGSD